MKRYGISKIVSTLLIMGIALAGSMIVYGVGINLVTNMNKNPDYTVSDIGLVKTPNNIQLLSFKIRNIGSVSITGVNVSLEGDDGVYNVTNDDMNPMFNSTDPLEPGEMSSYSSIVNTVSFTAGEYYEMNVKVTFIDGSVEVKTYQIYCSFS